MKAGYKKAQSATEYLLTYGWAFLIVGIVIASLYLFIFAPSTLTPSSCAFSAGAFCQDLVLGSSSTLSKMAMLLTNPNPYPVLDPAITVNVTGLAPIQGSCVPNFVLPGGAIICSATISPALSQGTLASGRFVFSYTPCPGGNVLQCAGNSRQSYTGSYNTHVSPLLSPTDITITLTAQNVSQVAISTSLDKLTANVKLLGTPLSGATVNFTSNSISATISPLAITSDGSGNAVSYISSSTSGNVFVTATFANVIANTIIAFTPPVCYTISIPTLSGASANAFTIDGVGYSSFPQQLCYGQGTSHTYSFQTTVAGAAGVQYLFGSASGCGQIAQSGILSSVTNCTLSANYIIQYFLTTSASPVAGGTVTPASSWYTSGSSATLGETSSAGYAFNGFVGTGTGSYTGANTAPSITLNNPITETGSFTSTSSTTTSTTSTSSTTTVPSNPSCGTFFGDALYSGSSTTLTCDLVASNAIIVNSGSTLNLCSHYIQGNVAVYNQGTITDTCSGGSGGTPGHQGSDGNGIPGNSGGAALSRMSAYFGVNLVGGRGGGGGGGGGFGGNLNNGCGGGGGGGVGGNGGGIIEIYAGNFINTGAIDASGKPGASGGGGGTSASEYGVSCCNSGPYQNGCFWGGGGGGGGGAGGYGGSVLIGYNNTSSVLFGTINVAPGSAGSGGSGGQAGGSGQGASAGCHGFGGGTGAANGGGGASGGGTSCGGGRGSGASGGGDSEVAGTITETVWIH